MPAVPNERRRRRGTATLFAMLVALLSRDVRADAAVPAVGRSFPIGHRVAGATVTMFFSPDDSDCVGANSIGSATLFASYSPGGPIIARQEFLPPFCLPSGRGRDFVFPGVPPATYYVAMVFGTVAAPNPALVAPGDWDAVNVFGACPGAPGYGLLRDESASAPPGTVQLFLGTADGCATTFDIDAGTTPGGTDIAHFTQLGESLTSTSTPAGRYYVRVRGRNGFGVGAYSQVLPLSVPPCAAGLAPTGATNFTYSLVGRTLTLSWTPSATPPGLPLTFHEIALWHQRINAQPPPTILLPSGMSSVTATVPPGAYDLEIRSGNACGSTGSPFLKFTVP